MEVPQDKLLECSKPLWGDLAAGSYDVGFQSLIVRDYSRCYELPRTSEEASFFSLTGRPMAVQVWYPAKPADNQATMLYETYLSVPSNDRSLQAFNESLNAFIFESVCKESTGKRWANLEPADAANLQTFLQNPTACYLDAPPLKGSFPVLIYHQGLGGCIVDNPTLLEFLASYGYVVATSSFQPEHGLSFGVDFNLTRSIKDITCLINTLCQHYAVDPARIGLLGHSYGASAVLSYAAEAQANIRAVVSLDSTREWGAESESLFEDMAERLSRAIRFMPPLMIFSMATPNVRFNHYDMLTYSDRYYITVKNLEHNDFVTPGPTATTISKGKANKQAQLIRSTSKTVCESILAFFDVYLEGNEPNQKLIETILQSTNQELQTLFVQVCRADTMPMSAKWLLEIFLTQGAEAGGVQVASASAEIAPEVLMQVGRGLQERGLHEDALLFYQALNQQLPDFSSAYEAIGDIYHYRLNNSLKARAAYQAALASLPGDLTLSVEQKAYRQRYLIEDIESLK